jgi:hypothetical protein
VPQKRKDEIRKLKEELFILNSAIAKETIEITNEERYEELKN